MTTRPAAILAVEIIALLCAVGAVGWLISGSKALASQDPNFMIHFAWAGSSMVSSVLMWALSTIIGLLSRIAAGVDASTDNLKKGITVKQAPERKHIPNVFQ